MATPAELVKAISDATGVPLATLVDIDRKLVKGKLRTKTGRGFSAARMTPLDAARLLTALLGSAQANASVDAVERYTRTQPDKSGSSEKLFASAELDELVALPSRHSFVDALAALLASAAGGSLARFMGANPARSLHIEVCAVTQETCARIQIADLPQSTNVSVEYRAMHEPKKAGRVRSPKRRSRISPQANAGDLEESRRITERTILPIAKLLARQGARE